MKDQAVSAVSIEVTSPLSLDICTAAVLLIGPVHSVPQALTPSKKKDFTSFCQPTQPIACANHGNHVQIIMKSRQSTT